MADQYSIGKKTFVGAMPSICGSPMGGGWGNNNFTIGGNSGGMAVIQPEAELLLAMLNVMKEQELTCMACPDYIVKNQYEYGLSSAERECIVAWIFSSVEDLGLRNETASSATNIFDRTLSVIPNIPKNQLQLVASACLIIASKMIEVNFAVPAEICFHAGNCFTVEDLKEAELVVLQTLCWSVNCVTVHTFLQAYLTIPHFANFGESFHCVAELYADLSCVEYELIGFKPSVVACAALMCTLELYNLNMEESLQVMLDLHLVNNLSETQYVQSILKTLHQRAQQISDTFPSSNSYQPDTPRTTLQSMHICTSYD